MDELSRRDFIGAAAALGGLALLQGGAPALARGLPPTAEEVANAVLMRRNVYCLAATSSPIAAYRAAITAMKALPATNGTSWLAQANIHGSFSPPPAMITSACQHGNQFFLSWHRMYLYYFERIIRHHSGSAAFALPYWGYSPSSVSRRVLPAMFRDTTSNLYISQRNPSVNTGSAISASAVDPGAALLQLVFGSFTSSLEGTPHGVVHNAVGGGGFMSYFETAGQDPIFWLHHAMVDRLWTAWLAQGGGRANPTSASWLTTSYSFYDETGATVTMSGQQVVDTATQLNYNYANPSCIRFPPNVVWAELTALRPFTRRELDLVEHIVRRPPLPDPPPPFMIQQQLQLGPARAELRVPANDQTKRALSRVAAGTREGPAAVDLVLEDIRLEQEPAVYYEVYVNLPAGERPVYTSASYVGNLDFFGPSPQGEHGKMPMRRTLSLFPAIIRLQAAGRWTGDVQVTFVPRAFTEDESPARRLRERPQATIGRVELQVR
jgi:hypothetical protein